MVNLDTHLMVFALEGTVTPRERRVLAGNTWSMSAIVLWELAKLAQLRRLIVFVAADRIGQVLLADVVAGEVVGVLVTGAPAELLGERRGRVPDVVRNGERAVRVHVGLGRRVGGDGGVGLGRGGEIDR